jgi:hypothetical protein
VLLTVGVIAAAGGVLTYQSPAAEKPAAPTAERPAGAEKKESSLSVAEFNRVFKDLQVKDQPWATVSWKASVTEALRLAARERKPVFMVVNTGSCLGFT